MARKYENLYLALWRVRELALETDGRKQGGRANLLYHALAMTQLFTKPPTLARWERDWHRHLPKFLFWLPLGTQALIFIHDLNTSSRGRFLNVQATDLGFVTQSLSLVIIFGTAALCTLYSNASDKRWTKTFLIVNPQFEEMAQPSFLEWLKARRRVEPGWGIVPDGNDGVYVGDVRARRLWQIKGDGRLLKTAKGVAARELYRDSDGTLRGSHSVWRRGRKEHGVWVLQAGAAKLEELLPPTPHPPQGCGPFQSQDGWMYSAESRREANRGIFRKHGKKDPEKFVGGADGHVDGVGESAGFTWIYGKVQGKDGTLYVTDSSCVRRISPKGEVDTIGSRPLGGLKRSVRPRLLGLTLREDDAGNKNLYVADFDLGCIWTIHWQENGNPEATRGRQSRGLWAPAGIAIAQAGHFFVLEHRSDTFWGRLASLVGPWARVVQLAKVDAGEEKPVVLATLGRLTPLKAFWQRLRSDSPAAPTRPADAMS